MPIERPQAGEHSRRMLLVLSRVLGLALTIGALPQSAMSQSSGLFGSRSVGGGSITAGNRNAFGDSGGAVGGTAGSRLDQIGNTAQITGSERYVRDNRTAGEFVGADTADTGFVGALTGGTTGAGGLGLGGFGAAGGLGGFGSAGGMFGGAGGRGNAALGGRGNQNQMNRANARQITVRTQLKIAFDYPTPPPTLIGQRLQREMNQLPTVLPSGLFPTIQVETQGRTIVLRGQVPDSDARALALELAKLEPGVDTVRDELTVETLGLSSP